MKWFIATTLFGAAFVLSAAAQPPDPLKPEKKVQSPPISLEGGYSIVSAERDGKAVLDVDTKEVIVRFTSEAMFGTDKGLQNLYGADYTLDTTKTPWTIAMRTTSPFQPFLSKVVAKDPVTATGRVKQEGDTVTLIYALPGGEVPTEFKTKDKQQMLVLKRRDDMVQPNKFQAGP